MSLAADGVLAGVALFLVHIARYDYLHLTIFNRSVVILLIAYALWAALTGFVTLPGDIFTAVLLFVMGLVLWFARLMGAGDAKLYFALGLFLGFQTLGVFAALLLAVTLIFMAAMFLAGRSGVKTGIAGRLAYFRETGKVPYAVIMCAAAIPAILMRMLNQT